MSLLDHFNGMIQFNDDGSKTIIDRFGNATTTPLGDAKDVQSPAGDRVLTAEEREELYNVGEGIAYPFE